MDQLGLVKPVDGFSQGIVVAVADVSHGRLDASFGQALCVFDGHVLAAPVAVMHEPAAMDGPPIMQRLLQCIEDEARLRRPAGPPSDDAAGGGGGGKNTPQKNPPRGATTGGGKHKHTR